jgi:hypothetical protein
MSGGSGYVDRKNRKRRSPPPSGGKYGRDRDRDLDRKEPGAAGQSAAAGAFGTPGQQQASAQSLPQGQSPGMAQTTARRDRQTVRGGAPTGSPGKREGQAASAAAGGTGRGGGAPLVRQQQERGGGKAQSGRVQDSHGQDGRTSGGSAPGGGSGSSGTAGARGAKGAGYAHDSASAPASGASDASAVRDGRGRRAQIQPIPVVKAEETVDDIKADIIRIEKEIGLEIKEIQSLKLAL